MRAQLKEVVVFMASPSDLAEERNTIRTIGEALNQLFASTQVRVRVVGWELTVPGFGRAQSQINPLVHECDIFIGLLNRRWGSATGDHSSGFEEEFDIAVQRRQDGDSPEIGMFFAQIDHDLLSDPGQQLSKVLEFKDRVRSEHIALYSEFKSAEQLGSQVQTFLMSHLLPLLSDGHSETGARDITAGPSQELRELNATSAPDESSNVSMNPAMEQLSETLDAFAALVKGQTPSSVPDIDRLSLFGRMLEDNPEPLGAHLVNRLYRKIKELHLLEGEARLWLRTFYRDLGQAESSATRTVPGWSVLNLKQSSNDELDNHLTTFTRHEDNLTARGALRVLKQLKMRPQSLWGYESDGSESESDQKAIAAWVAMFDVVPGIDAGFDYLVSQVQPSDKKILEDLQLDPKLNKTSKDAVAALRAALDGDYDALAALAPYHLLDSDSVSTFLAESIERVPTEGLDKLARFGTPYLRRAAIRCLVARDDLKGSLLSDVLAWKDQESLKVMVEKACSSPEFGEVVIEILAKDSSATKFPEHIEARFLAVLRTPEELRALLDSSPMNHSAWTALALKLGKGMLEDARRVLDTDASDFRKEFDTLPDEYASTIDYVAERYRAAACVLLGDAGEGLEDEIRLAKEVGKGNLLSPRPALNALSLIAVTEHFGEIEEALPALDNYIFAQDADDLMKSNIAPVLANLWKTAEVHRLRQASARWFVTQSETSDEELTEALYADDEDVRMTALETLVSRKSHEDLRTLLDSYYKSDTTYWYNIIAGLDEALHGPSSLTA